MSFFAASALRDRFGLASTKIPIDVSTCVSHVLPPVVFYILFAVLAVTPQTRAVRVALWPVIALLAFRSAVIVDASCGDPNKVILDVIHVISMLTITVHTLSWALVKGPLVRHVCPANSTPSTLMDALDLALRFRGHGWDWSHGLYVPRDTRPTHRYAFASYTLFATLPQCFLNAALHCVIQTCTAHDNTLFDPSLAPPMRYLRASVLSTLLGLAAYNGVSTGYNLATVLGVVLLGQDPAQWPPAFDRPWCATSLCAFWGRRWHQFFRHMFLVSARPLAVLGRAGEVVGVFLTSALYHHLILIVGNPRSEMWRMGVGFGMMGVGILGERVFYKVTGRKVGGVVGWVWTMAWLLLWGNVIVDGFVRGGMFASPSAIDGLVSVRMWIDNLAIGIDAWLHTI